MSIWDTFVSNVASGEIMKLRKHINEPPWTAADEAIYKILLGNIDIGLDKLQENYPPEPIYIDEYWQKLSAQCLSIMHYDKDVREGKTLSDVDQAKYVLLERNIKNVSWSIAKINGIQNIKNDIIEQASLKSKKVNDPENWFLYNEMRLADLGGQIEEYVWLNQTIYPYNPPDDSAQREALLDMCRHKLSFRNMNMPEYLLLVRNIKNLAKSLELIKPIPTWDFTTLELVCNNIAIARHTIEPHSGERLPIAEYNLQYNEAYARKIVAFMTQNGQKKSCWSKIKKFLNRYL